MNIVTIRQFKEAAKHIHPKQAILLRGRSGIGKSQIAYQFAQSVGKPIIERRAAQLTESDLIGLPDKTPRGATCFHPPDWFLDAEEEPHVIFFDEPNRSTLEVGQALFQFVEKGELNGRCIHPESQIICAVNFTSEYQVSPMDFALLDRFVIFDLEPDREDWLTWAKGRIHPALTTFVRQCNADHFEIFPEAQAKMDAATITPSRRSWERLNRDVTSGESPLINDPGSAAFYHLASGYVGSDSSRALVSFMVDAAGHVTAEEVLQDYAKVADKVACMTPERMLALVDKIIDRLKGLDLADEQAKNVVAFMTDLPVEISVSMWPKMSVANTAILYRLGGTQFFKILESADAL